MTMYLDIDGATIDELAIPESLDADGGRDFSEMVALRNTVEREILETEDFSPTARELLAAFHDAFAPKRLLLARSDGRIIARGVYEWQPEENAPAVFLELQVARDRRRRGIGTAMLNALEQLAAEDGFSVLQTWSTHRPPTSDDVVVSPTGFGAVDRSSPAVHFALARGYRLEQVDRISHIDLPVEPAMLAERRSKAETYAADYEVVQWVGRCPGAWLTDMAQLHQRMSTDAPAAAIEFAEEQWDEQRMRNLDDINDAGGRLNVTSAAVHRPTGRLVGYTDIAVPEQAGRPATQEDTLVLREHRGHRLGMLLKVANLEQVTRISPVTPRVTTFNAEENRPMLSVNEAVGFVASGYGAAWKKTV